MEKEKNSETSNLRRTDKAQGWRGCGKGVQGTRLERWMRAFEVEGFWW